MPASSVPIARFRSDRGNAAVTDVAVMAVSTLLLLTVLKIASLLTRETQNRFVELTNGDGQSADPVTPAAAKAPAAGSATDDELWNASSPVLQPPGSAAAAHPAIRLPMEDRPIQPRIPDNSAPLTAEPPIPGPDPVKPQSGAPGEPAEPVEPTEPAAPEPARPARPAVRPAPKPLPEADPWEADAKSEESNNADSQSEDSGIPVNSGSGAGGQTAAGGAQPGPTSAMGFPNSGFPSGGFPGGGFPGNPNGMFQNAGWGSPQPPFPYPLQQYDPRSQAPSVAESDAAEAQQPGEPAQQVRKSRTSGRTPERSQTKAAMQRTFSSNRADAAIMDDAVASQSEPPGIVPQAIQQSAEAFGVNLTEDRTIEVVQFDNSNADRPKLELICHRKFRQLQVYSGSSPRPLAFEAPPAGERRALPLHVDWSQPGTILRIYGIEEETAEMLRYTIPGQPEESESALEPDAESNQAIDDGDGSLESEGYFVLPPLAEVKGE